MAQKDGESFRISTTPAIILAQLLGIAAITLMLVWLLHFQGGISVNSDSLQRNFNAHPFFMLIGIIILGGEAIMIHKIVPGSKKNRKFVHMLVHLMALALGGLGLYAAFKIHRDAKLAHMYSLHSWFGMGTIILYISQWLVAFFTFLFPGAKTAIRANYLPYHAFFGIVIFIMAVISAEAGLVEKFIHSGLFRGTEALLVNFIGVVIFLFGIATILTVYFREPIEK